MSRATGRVSFVFSEPAGSVLVLDALSGAVTLQVENASDFNEGGGLLSVSREGLEPVVLSYVSANADTDVITLGAPLNFNAWQSNTTDINDCFIGVYPESSDLMAAVVFDDRDEGIQARIPTELTAYFEEGIREPGLEEAVAVSDDTGQWLLVEVADQLLISGKAVSSGDGTGGTLEPTEPPAYSPNVEVLAGSGVAVVRWEPVPGATYYDLHVTAGDGTPVSEETLYQSNSNSPAFVSFLSLEARTPLPLDKDSYFQVVARNSLGSAPSGDWVAGRPGPINDNVLTASLAIITSLISNSIETNGINIGLGSWTEDLGFQIPGVVDFPVNGSGIAKITAEATLTRATVERLTLVGMLNKIAGGLYLAAGVSAPTTPPRGVVGAWPSTAQIAATGTAVDFSFGNYKGMCTSLANSGLWLMCHTLFGGSQIVFQNKTTGEAGYLFVDTSTEGQRGIPSYGAQNYFETCDVITLGTSYVVLGNLKYKVGSAAPQTAYYARVFNSSWQWQRDIPMPFTAGSYGYYEPRLVTDGTDFGFIGCDQNGRMLVNWCNINGARQTSKDRWIGSYNTAYAKALRAAIYLSPSQDSLLDVGRYYVLMDSDSVYRCFTSTLSTPGGNPTAAPDTARNFFMTPKANTAIAWNPATSRLTVRDTAGKLWRHGRFVSTTTLSLTYTKYDGTGPSFAETNASPAASINVYPRSWFSVETDPPGDTGDDQDPEINRIYVNNQRQAELGAGVLVAYYDDLYSGTTAPVTNGFANRPGGFGQVLSEKTGANGPLTELKGDGSARIEGTDTWKAVSGYQSGVSASAFSPKYRKDPVLTVWMSGAVTLTATPPSGGKLIFTLPVGYRPAQIERWMVMGGNAGQYCFLQVGADGNVILLPGGGSPTTVFIGGSFSSYINPA